MIWRAVPALQRILPMNIALTRQEVEAFFRAGTKEIVNRELE